MSDEHDTVLDEPRDRSPELSVDDEIRESLSLLELPLIDSTKTKVQNNKNSKTIKRFKR